MDTYGHIFTHMDTYGHMWARMDTYGHMDGLPWGVSGAPSGPYFYIYIYICIYTPKYGAVIFALNCLRRHACEQSPTPRQN